MYVYIMQGQCRYICALDVNVFVIVIVVFFQVKRNTVHQLNKRV